MIIYSKVIEAPDSEPVTLDEAKAHLKIDSDNNDEDVLITSLIKTARRLCEAYTSRSFVTQVRRMNLDQFPSWGNSWPGFYANWRRHDGIIIPYGPVQSIDSITYLVDGSPVTLDVSGFTQDINGDVARLFPVDGWPSEIDDVGNAVTIEYTAGYDPISGGTEELPEEVKTAMLLMIASFYENRQDETPDKVNKIDWHSERILDPIKVYWNADTY